MEERIDKLMDQILCCLEIFIDKNGVEALDTDETGKIIDQIKDLAEAKYHIAVVEAMEEGESIPYVSNTVQKSMI